MNLGASCVSDCELTDTYSPAAIDMAPATSPATPAIKTSFCVAAAAATPTIKVPVETIPSLAPRTLLSTTRYGRRDGVPGAGEDDSSNIPSVGSDSPKQQQYNDDDQDNADDTDATVTVAVAVAAEAATESTEQENDEERGW